MTFRRRILAPAFALALCGCSSSTAILGQLRADASAPCAASESFCRQREVWSCDATGTSSTLVSSCSGGCLEGVCIATPNCGAAAFFDGSTGRIASAATVAGQFTFEGWFYAVAPVGTPYGRLAAVEASGPCASGTQNWEIRIAADGTVSAALGGAFSTSSTGGFAGFGRWFHVALQYEGVPLARLYVDGVSVQTFITPTAPTFGAGCPIRIATADDGSSKRAQVMVASVRYSSAPTYADTFARPIQLVRDASTLWLFDMPASGGSFPLVDGSVVFQGTNVTLTTAGPGC